MFFKMNHWLDTTTSQQAVQLMWDLGWDHQCTVNMATHGHEITATADSVIRLMDGRIHEEVQ
jgi:ABC-type lipoprotein export system ATPase subunit